MLPSNGQEVDFLIVEILLVAILVVLLLLVYFSLFRARETKVPDGITQIVGDVDRKHTEIIAQLGKLSGTLDERTRQQSDAQRVYQEKVDMSLSGITRALSGTRRGGAGESILKEILSAPIRSGLVETDLPVGTDKVEFAWKVGYGKYVPIDAKLPEIEQLYDQYTKSNDTAEQKKTKSEIVKKLEKQIKAVKEYKNKDNTLDKCILAVPDGLMEVLPEMSGEIGRSGVVVCGYSQVFFHAYYIAEAYIRTRESGDIGVYQQTIHELLGLMKEIADRSTTIDKGLTQISNADREIRDHTTQSERYKLAEKDQGSKET